MSNEPLDLLITAGVRRAYAERIVAAVGPHGIGTLTAAELTGAGVPAATARKIAAAIALGRRTYGATATVIDRPDRVFDLLRARAADLQQEVFWMLPISVRNELIGGSDGIVEVARGTVAGVEVHPREIFRSAIRVSAAGVVVAHNHPSGDPTPSMEDLHLTQRLREVGTLLGIPVIDHIVVTRDKYRSIAEWCPELFAS